MIGLLDSSIKLVSQTDLKKVIAYCTIFEMNSVLFIIFLYGLSSQYIILYFSILHTTFSFMFFFLSDIIYKRFGTRSIKSISNIYENYKYISIFIIISILLFNGVPFTLKFNIEFFFLLKLNSLNFFLSLLFIISNIIFLISFNKIFFSLIFGNYNFFLKKNDLSKLECVILMILYTLLLFI